jgi:DNA-binding PadR family transcriptional regulator
MELCKMSLKHAILGFLTMRPFSGYEMTKLINESINAFWSATQSQVYQTLKQLKNQGLVRMERVQQENRPDKKVYEITDKGKEELLDWLTTPQGLPTFRIPLLVQITFSYHLENDQILALFQSHANACRQRLESLRRGEETERYMKYGTPRMQRLWQLTRTNGIGYYEAELDWIEQAIEDLKDLPSE